MEILLSTFTEVHLKQLLNDNGLKGNTAVFDAPTDGTGDLPMFSRKDKLVFASGRGGSKLSGRAPHRKFPYGLHHPAQLQRLHRSVSDQPANYLV